MTIREQAEACTPDRKTECQKDAWWNESYCTGCQHNIKPSLWVAHLSWLDSVLTGAGGVEMEALELTTWEDLGVYRQVVRAMTSGL